MNKKVLAIYYSQSGQMVQVIDQFIAPLRAAGAEVDVVRVETAAEFVFPWTGRRFFGVMPDCVLGNPTDLKPFTIPHQKYDLIVLGYQPWFLSPSIPSNSLLHHPDFLAVLKDTPVITISAARNMWLSAYDRVRQMLIDAGASHVGNVALFDKHHNLVSFVTIFYWMLTGKKDRYLNIFPPPGVAEEDILQTADFGKIAAVHLQQNNYTGMQQTLVDSGAVKIIYKLMLAEGKARIIFRVWAKFIAKRRNQTAWLSVFKYYLFVALFFGVPLLFILDAILVRPFTGKRIGAKTKHYQLLA